MNTTEIISLIEQLREAVKEREILAEKEANIQADIDQLDEDILSVQSNIRDLDQTIEDLESDILSEAKEV